MDVYLGTIAIFAGKYAPRGYAFCNGQVLSTAQYSALYTVIGNTYGGSTQNNTFALPDLRGRLPMHTNDPARGLKSTSAAHPLGQQVGAENITLDATQIPPHNHTLQGSSVAADLKGANNAVLAVPSQRIYGTGTPQALSSTALVPTGGNSSHANLQPALALNFIIAIAGIFPQPQ